MSLLTTLIYCKKILKSNHHYPFDSNAPTTSDTVIRAEAGIKVNIKMVVKSSIIIPCS